MICSSSKELACAESAALDENPVPISETLSSGNAKKTDVAAVGNGHDDPARIRGTCYGCHEWSIWTIKGDYCVANLRPRLDWSRICTISLPSYIPSIRAVCPSSSIYSISSSSRSTDTCITALWPLCTRVAHARVIDPSFSSTFTSTSSWPRSMRTIFSDPIAVARERSVQSSFSINSTSTSWC